MDVIEGVFLGPKEWHHTHKKDYGTFDIKVLSNFSTVSIVMKFASRKNVMEFSAEDQTNA